MMMMHAHNLLPSLALRMNENNDFNGRTIPNVPGWNEIEQTHFIDCCWCTHTSNGLGHWVKRTATKYSQREKDGTHENGEI